jgi:hypothetical protein
MPIEWKTNATGLFRRLPNYGELARIPFVASSIRNPACWCSGIQGLVVSVGIAPCESRRQCLNEFAGNYHFIVNDYYGTIRALC